MTAALKLPPRPSYSIGDISTRSREVAMAVECKRCGTLRPQQLMSLFTVRHHMRGAEWAVLPCSKCPIDLGVRP